MVVRYDDIADLFVPFVIESLFQERQVAIKILPSIEQYCSCRFSGLKKVGIGSLQSVWPRILAKDACD